MVHYHTYQFLARNGPNREAQFFATAFSDQSLSNHKNNQTKTNQMMGWIENRPNKFLNRNFVRQTLPPKQRCYVLCLPVLNNIGESYCLVQSMIYFQCLDAALAFAASIINHVDGAALPVVRLVVAGIHLPPPLRCHRRQPVAAHHLSLCHETALRPAATIPAAMP